jgi:hypothetical protein
MSNSIQFIIQRHNEGPDHDVVIRIMQDDGIGYQVDYFDKEDSDRYSMEMDEYSTLRYIQTTMDMLATDKDPFEYFQMIVPGFPSIQFKIHQLNNSAIRSNIFYCLKTCMRRWPTLSRPVRRRLFAPPPGGSPVETARSH